MELFSRYRYILAGITILGIILLLRDSSTARFRYDAERWAEPTFSGANIISEAEIGELPGEKMIVALSRDDSTTFTADAIITYIPADSVMAGKYRKTLSKHKGTILLYHADISVSARVWMVLSQTGHRSVYIIDRERSNELLKEKIRDDSMTIPDL